MSLLAGLAVSLLLLGSVPVASAATDFADLLANPGFEDDLDHSHWTATRKNGNYKIDAPEVNPSIVPFGETDPLTAPAGSHFVGIVNPGDQDVNGRLVHEVVSGPFAAGTEFTVTVYGNRGRLPAASSAAFGTGASELTIQVFAWGPGAAPVVNPATDGWSRTPKLTFRGVFTAWAANGQWGVQTFTVVLPQPMSFLTLAVTGKNHKAASYVAFDILIP